MILRCLLVAWLLGAAAVAGAASVSTCRRWPAPLASLPPCPARQPAWIAVQASSGLPCGASGRPGRAATPTACPRTPPRKPASCPVRSPRLLVLAAQVADNTSDDSSFTYNSYMASLSTAPQPINNAYGHFHALTDGAPRGNARRSKGGAQEPRPAPRLLLPRYRKAGAAARGEGGVYGAPHAAGRACPGAAPAQARACQCRRRRCSRR